MESRTHFTNFNGCAVETWDWMSNVITHFIVDLFAGNVMHKVDSLHKGSVMRKTFPCDDVIMISWWYSRVFPISGNIQWRIAPNHPKCRTKCYKREIKLFVHSMDVSILCCRHHISVEDPKAPLWISAIWSHQTRKCEIAHARRLEKTVAGLCVSINVSRDNGRLGF